MSDLTKRDKDIHDPSAFDEYYKLKQKLGLSEQEQFIFAYYIAPRVRRRLQREENTQNIRNVVDLVNNYRYKYRVKIYILADLIGIHRIVLSRILHHKVKPQTETIRRLQEFLKDYA